MEEAENPWNALDDVEAIDVKDGTYPVVAAWPKVAGAQETWQWSSAALYVPFYRQLCADRRWADMTYSCDARQTMGGQDDPEWDHLEVTSIIGMNGSKYDLQEYCEHYERRSIWASLPHNLGNAVSLMITVILVHTDLPSVITSADQLTGFPIDTAAPGLVCACSFRVGLRICKRVV